MSIQLALLGCGHIHTPGFINAIKKRSDVKIKSVWDHDAARGQQRADELSARFLGDYRTILGDPEVSGVIVCSETDRHRELVLATTNAKKKFIFVEKPLGMTGKDAIEMADAIDRSGATFQTGYFMRGFPIFNFLREHIAKGSFGKITRVRGSNCHSGALGGWFDKEWRWMADPKIAGCGAFGDLGTHSLDIILWLLGDVTETVATIDNGTARYPGCEETGEAIMRFKNGAIGTLAAAWDDVANPIPFLLSGTEGHAMIFENQLFISSKKIEGADGKSPFTNLPQPKIAGFDAFLDACAGKDANLVSAKEAAYRNAVVEAMYKSVQTKKWEPI